MNSPNRGHMIFDPIYGFIHLTLPEWEIIHSPFYQRLRWIKQLGFSTYVFPGAEHSRYGHSIGVLYNAHKILGSCEFAVSDRELFDVKCLNPKAIFHKTLRLAALMHDLGTFPFSHTLEGSYLRFKRQQKKKKEGISHKEDHESLGFFIIENTNYPGGITHILEKYGFDPKQVASLIRGDDPSVLANQILHSEIDCDRMDYLLRDAHYTGLKYGTYDRDYLLHHFRSVKVGNKDILTIGHNALHCIEDFLIARFAWYSQVIRSSRGAKFDAIAEELGVFLLEKGLIYQYEDLLELAAKSPMKFFQFNDAYFMNVIQEIYHSGKFSKNLKIKSLAHDLLLERSPKSIKCEEFDQRLLKQDNQAQLDKIIKRAHDKLAEIEKLLSEDNNPNHWVVSDIPQKNIIFIKSRKSIVRELETKKVQNLLLQSDPVKISFGDGSDVKLLADVESSIIYELQDTVNFVPNVFCSESAYDFLMKKKIITTENNRSQLKNISLAS